MIGTDERAGDGEERGGLECGGVRRRGINRRGILGMGVLGVGVVGSGVVGGALSLEPDAARAQSSSPARGPRVWLDMDQQQLDDAYDQSKYAPNTRQVLARCATNSEALRARIGSPQRLGYGDAPIEGLDLWAAKAPTPHGAPVLVYAHGGAWRGGMAKDFACLSETFTHAGVHVAMLDFSNVIETKGDLMPMADQVRRGIAWVVKNAASFGGDPARIYIGGHSSGAHLMGSALVAEWEKDYGIPPTAIKGAVLSSGMYDLKPVRLSARSSYVKFTDAMEDALSAQRHLGRIAAPVTILHGSLETPEFQRQSRDFVAALTAAGKPARLIVAEGYNHFEIMETLGSPYGWFGRAALAMMQLAPA